MGTQKIEFNDANFDSETRVGLSVVCFKNPWDIECRNEAAIAERFRVTRIHTILILKDGKDVERLTGFRHEKALIKHLEKHL